MTFSALYHSLRRLKAPLALGQILALLDGLTLRASDLARHVRFARDHYVRNLMQRGDFHELLLLCWTPGQASPFHDHSGSTCGVRVVQGVAHETKVRDVFEGRLLVQPETEARAGALVASQGRDIHSMANHGPEPLMTLHLYSPPLRAMREYSVEVEALPTGA